MTTLLEIKPYIHDFIEENLDASFEGKVYWIAERRIVPEYPYCLLNVIAENKDKRTSRHSGHLIDSDVRQSITTRYKTCTITVSVYNGWMGNTSDEFDMDETKEFTYEQIDNLEGAFEDYPINNMFSVQNISPIRQLHEVADGGYVYRYEFDLTIGYNEERIINKERGRGVIVDVIDTNEPHTSIQNNSVYIDGEDAIENDLDKDYFKQHCEVVIDNNGNIVIET